MFIEKKEEINAQLDKLELEINTDNMGSYIRDIKYPSLVLWSKYQRYLNEILSAFEAQSEYEYKRLEKIITLLNKQDLVGENTIRDLRADYTLRISAKTGEGLSELKKVLGDILSEEQIYIERLFPYNEAGKIQLIREYGQLLEEEYTGDGIQVKARVPREIYGQLI